MWVFETSFTFGVYLLGSQWGRVAFLLPMLPVRPWVREQPSCPDIAGWATHSVRPTCQCVRYELAFDCRGKFTQQIWLNECLLTFYLSAPVTTFWSKRFEHQWPSHLSKNFGCQTITQYLVCGSEFSLDAPFSPELGVDWRCVWSELGLFSPTPDEVDDVVEECWNCESDECKCISVIIGYIEGAILIWEKKSTFFHSNQEGSWVHLKSATAAL